MPVDIILHNCTKNHYHMLYCSWDRCVTDVIVIFHFGLCFCPFTILIAWIVKIKNHFTQVYQKSWSYVTLFLDMVRDRCNYFSFWAIFCHPYPPPTPNSPKNQNFKKTKKQKTPGDIILHMCTKNYDYMLCGSWAMVRDGEMDGKSDIEVGAPPRTNQYFSNRVQLSLGWKKKEL